MREDEAAEIARRRTFAIISHPDAGKTTLTEKMLLYSGALQLAGSVRARRRQRATVSDWMAMERQRGISITSTVLAFDYAGCRCNLLDTPGHADFSEDTYRTLTAVDAAVMVVDAARGVEEQTRKLFAVCRARRIPILTFVNKLDRPGLPPLPLLSAIEAALGIEAVPLNWPVGDGPDFQGVYDRERRVIHRYQRVEHGARLAPVEVAALGDPLLPSAIGAAAAARLREEVELLEGAGAPFDLERFADGRQSPVCFGSALTNFGVDLFLDRFVALCPPPEDAGDERFAGFVFKIQSNMNPLHRDSIAFVRVARGVFHRDLVVQHLRTGRRLRVAQAHTLFAQERETVETAYAGDVIGLANPGYFAIGDSLYVGAAPEPIVLPRFQPEHFAVLRQDDVTKGKAFARGLEQLELEGAVQVLRAPGGGRPQSVLAAVGLLQFEVVQYRLRAEYGVEAAVEPLPYRVARWVEGPEAAVAAFAPYGTLRCEDAAGRPLVLFPNQRELDYYAGEHPEVRLRALDAPADASLAARP